MPRGGFHSARRLQSVLVMASIGHIVVGMAVARWEAQQKRPLLASLFASMVLWSGLSLLPDADVIGFRLGVRYEDEWGHRGASHSLAIALAAALLTALIARLAGRPFGRAAWLAFIVVGSHGLLDTLTDGGLGAALLWPLSDERLFAPVTPLPVAPIGRGILSPRGLYVMAVELVWFAPIAAFSLWPRRTADRAVAPEGGEQ